MKKYFMKGTEDEVQFGEIIELDLTKRTDRGTMKHQHLEVEFCPEIVDYLVEEEIIEVKEFKEEPAKQGILNFEFDDNKDREEDYDEEDDDECPFEEILSCVEDLQAQIADLRHDFKEFLAGFKKEGKKEEKKDVKSKSK